VNQDFLTLTFLQIYRHEGGDDSLLCTGLGSKGWLDGMTLKIRFVGLTLVLSDVSFGAICGS